MTYRMKLLALIIVGITIDQVELVKCYKCADRLSRDWKSYIKEVKFETSRWVYCDQAEVVECTFGCYETSLKVFDQGISIVRTCATDRVMSQLKLTQYIPERQDNKTFLMGRMCTIDYCNIQYKNTSLLVEWITINFIWIIFVLLVVIVSISLTILTICYIIKRNRRNSGYQRPCDATPISP